MRTAHVARPASAAAHTGNVLHNRTPYKDARAVPRGMHARLPHTMARGNHLYHTSGTFLRAPPAHPSPDLSAPPPPPTADLRRVLDAPVDSTGLTMRMGHQAPWRGGPHVCGGAVARRGMRRSVLWGGGVEPGLRGGWPVVKDILIYCYLFYTSTNVHTLHSHYL